ncbi:hypothetical protein PanWU01x14_123060 [Parasponia andersonii]|uniref:Increased DNA methylation 1 C-terminal domain-containing protein n=1 Tax=Parasponia andersonii TaxID=3476 RepID=A0A2P5CU58_PARAD|nr:hypothetical protein PanWU01x14_123060 [Parasponia andersonii]
MLRCCILDLGGNWDDHLPLVEFAYNNNYQTSVGMEPYEVSYGILCRSLLYWAEPEEHVTLGPEREIEFDSGDSILLKVTLRCGVTRFGVKGKLKYTSDPSYVVQYVHVPIQEDVSYEEQHVHLLARELKVFRNREIPFIKGTITVAAHPSVVWPTKQHAELPQVTVSMLPTSRSYRRQRRTRSRRGTLSHLEVENLVIPSAEGVEGMWINNFQFSSHIDKSLEKFISLSNMMTFPKTRRLRKAILSNIAQFPQVGGPGNPRRLPLFDLNLEPPQEEGM